MANNVVRFKNTEVAHYNPAKGLKNITVNEALERHYTRARDARNLLKAMEAKLREVRKFVLWWDRQGYRKGGGDTAHRNRTVTVVAGKDGMPIRETIKRWRDRTKSQEDFERALADAQRRAQRIGDLENANTIRGTKGTGEFERYTPAKYIELARKVLGEIDLDPASCVAAQRIVKAKEYFTTRENGLVREWHGRVWLNPPYHRELGPQFVAKLIAERVAGRVTAAVMLTNNCTDTEWFGDAVRASDGLSFTRGRINFLIEDGSTVLPTQGQAFFYFGDQLSVFDRHFGTVGYTMLEHRHG
jgi:hypothetical protein